MIKKIIEKNGTKYRLLDYIESTGNQYINTGINIPIANLKAKFKYYITATTDSCILGSNAGGGQSFVRFDTGDLHYRALDGVYGRTNEPINRLTEVELTATSLKIDGENIQKSQSHSYTDNGLTLKLLATTSINESTIRYLAKARLYYCDLYNNNTLVRQFMPVERITDNEIGMIDIVSGVFYGNDGTGIFVKGNYVTKTNVYSHKLKAKAYKKLEYIEATGTQFIDLGSRSISRTADVVECKYKFNEYSTSSSATWIFSNQQTSAANPLDLYSQNSVLRARANGGSFDTPADTDIHEIKIDFVNSKVVFDGEDSPITTAASFTGDLNLFRRNTGTGYSKANIYSFKYSKSGTTILDLVPVRRLRDNEIGLLNLVDMTFYGNDGTGTFEYEEEGTDIYYYEEVEQVDYIECTGTQMIDTGFKPNQDTKIDIDYDANTGANGSAVYFGSTTSFATDSFGFYRNANGQKIFSNYDSDTNIVDIIPVATFAGKHHLVQDKNNLYFDEVLIKEHTYHAFQSANSLFIGAIEFNAAFNYKGKIFKAKIWDNGIPIRDYVPVKTTANEYCLLDLIEMKLYHNAGAGIFSGGTRTKKLKRTMVVVDNDEKYYRLDYLQSAGTHRISTNIPCNNIGKIDVIFSIDEIKSGSQMMYGYYDKNLSAGNRGCNYLQYSTGSMYVHGRGSNHNFNPIQQAVVDRKYHFVSPISKDGTGYLYDYDDNDTQIATIELTAQKETGNMTLFVIGGNATIPGHYSYGKMYSFKMYDLEDHLISDLIPAEKADGTKGMLDLKNHVFYANSGTGVFGGNKKVVLTAP